MSGADQALALNQSANELKRNGQYEEAVQRHEQALQLAPTSPQLWHDLAATYYAWERFEAAEAGFTMALQVAPQDPQLHFSLATTMLQLRRPSQALHHLHQAVQLKPDYATAWMNLGTTIKDLGDLETAEVALCNAIELAPSDWEAVWNLALLELFTGRFESGWARYEARRHNPAFREPQGTPWDGSAQPDATLLVRFEQGLGDTLQFMRFTKLARERVGKVILQVNPVLMSVLEGFHGADEVISAKEPDPPCDIAAPLLSLPHLLGVGEAVGPTGGAYLHADPALVEAWRARLAGDSRMQVGVVWQGNPSFKADYRRSIPLRTYEPVLRTDGVRFMSLQKMHGLEQLADLPADIRLEDIGSELDEETGPFCDTAALMTCLDLVITSDTSVAHLAGALGIPVWVGLPTMPDWRWEATGEACRWHPTMRLFRQEQTGDWDGVMARIAKELKDKVAAHDEG